jgi:hypothetical protein
MFIEFAMYGVDYRVKLTDESDEMGRKVLFQADFSAKFERRPDWRYAGMGWWKDGELVEHTMVLASTKLQDRLGAQLAEAA